MPPINQRVRQDAEKIVERLRTTDVTMVAIAKEYGVRRGRIASIVKQALSPTERQRLIREKIRLGAKTSWQKNLRGLVPWNAGLRGLHLSPATEFQRGTIRAGAARRYKPIGSICVNIGRRRVGRGRIRRGKPVRKIKVKDCGRPNERWIPYARYLWEKEHGPVPPGYYVAHKDGDSMNDALENLVLVNHREHSKLLLDLRPDILNRARAKSIPATKRFQAEKRKMRKSLGRIITRYECVACEAEFPTKPERCPKCGTISFRKKQRREREIEYIKAAGTEAESGRDAVCL